VNRVALLLVSVLSATSLANAQTVLQGNGAVLRGLDKLEGRTSDLEVPVGGSAKFGRLLIEVEKCTYPEGDSITGSRVLLRITDSRDEAPRFTGWMLAESPALSAMDHPRYDVWLLSCTSS